MNFSEACRSRLKVCLFKFGSSENQSTTAPGSGSKLNASLPQNSASIAAAAITVFPAPVVAVRENDEISCLSRFLKLSRARFRLARMSSTACSW